MKLKIDGLTFGCENAIEDYRVRSLLTKEPGTIAWLRDECREGDVLFDVGANIGLYSVFAARLMGVSGMVVAFEPHVGSAHRLVQNVLLNGLGLRVRLVTAALDDYRRQNTFNYANTASGASGSQLGHAQSEAGTTFNPQFVEWKIAEPGDAFAERLCPTLIKIDVDGNELRILRGFQQTLLLFPPRSIQVEMHPNDADAIIDLLRSNGYDGPVRHDTHRGASLIERGVDPATVPYNGIFRRAA